MGSMEGCGGGGGGTPLRGGGIPLGGGGGVVTPDPRAYMPAIIGLPMCSLWVDVSMLRTCHDLCVCHCLGGYRSSPGM